MTGRCARSAAAGRRPRAVRGVVLLVLAAGLLGGCRADPPATGAPAVSTTADPLTGVDAELDAVERDLDADAAG